MNWRIKILAKLALSRLNLSYATWHRLGIFVHGNMDDTDYALHIAQQHLSRLNSTQSIEGSTCLELGPGDSLASAIVANAYGAKKFYLVDTGKFADENLSIYAAIATKLRAKGLKPIDFSNISSTSEMLEMVNAEYLTNGLNSLKTVQSDSIDFIWSQAVLEHVRISEVGPLFTEFFRILKPGGLMSHSVDFKDHLGGALNNLRFSSRLWESNLMANSGFYTNRIRYGEMLQRMENAGFQANSAEAEQWDTPKILRHQLAKEFRNLSDSDILTYRGKFVLRKN